MTLSTVTHSTMTRSRYLVGNWKMNGSLHANDGLLWALRQGLDDNHPEAGVHLAVAVPAPYLAQAQALLADSPMALAAQDVSAQPSGAYTGEWSAAMLRDFEVSHAIVGHSERRAHHGETDDLVARKARAALGHGITPIICLGETQQERASGQTEAVLGRQLHAVIERLGADIAKTMLAYEPVWAIGTGVAAGPGQAQEIHAWLRVQLAQVCEARDIPLLYGGSMNPANADALLAQPDIDGGLVGAASLRAADFLALIAAVNLAAST